MAMSKRGMDALLGFFRWEAAGGLLLILAAIAALVMANSPLAEAYRGFLDLPLHLDLRVIAFEKTTLLWINDLLMAVFFLLVGLELKREIAVGQFADSRQILLPVACAIGGMAVPMLIYAAINAGDATALRGVAVPAATDIAFALGILSLLGSRVPLALKMLLTAIAVADDLGAIIIIAIFYTEQLTAQALISALVVLSALVLLNRAGVKSLWPYLLLGLLMWTALLKSGVHATLAGVALGFCIPLQGRDEEDRPLERLEHGLHPWVAYLILPLFAFANAGVALQGLGIEALSHPVTMGIVLGLLLGKPLGVFLLGAALIKTRVVAAPEGVSLPMILGMSLLCAIGFTMSLFIGSLAFEHSGESWMVATRIGILCASTLAAIGGFLVLRQVLPKSA